MRRPILTALLGLGCTAAASPLFAEEQRSRQIEEVLVTAEKREASTQDTSISITAFQGEFLQDFGIRNQEDLANFIPATTIQPYDVAVRGIGRSFRALGGDPGIATYFDGVYSEDFGIASTEGGLYDIERIEVLRGPQGTLYGRNAVGGAINFISKSPTDEFEGEIKTNVGSRGLFEVYGLLSGPIIKDKLNYRFNGIKRERNGYYNDLGFSTQPRNEGERNPNAGNYGDENYVLTLEWLPTENISWKVRANERSYARRMGGAGQTAGIIALSEFGGLDRDSDSQVFGFRPILSSRTDGFASTFDAGLGADALAASGNPNLNLTDPTQANFLNTSASTLTGNGLTDLFSFSNPNTGETILAQRLRPGIDPAQDDEPSRNFNCAGDQTCILGPVRDADDFDGDDLDTATNGQQQEFFDHQAVYSNLQWDLNDTLTVKYVFGYTDFFYDRTTDRDLTSNTAADETFYVSQENENFQHELQFLFDFGERATFTSGLFYYESSITQRGDFYSSVGEDRYTQPVDYGLSPQGIPNAAILGGIFPANPTLFSGRDAVRNGTLTAAQQVALDAGNTVNTVGLWLGDNPNNPGGCTRLTSGPVTCGSFVEYETQLDSEAFAWYNQAELFLSDQLSLTLGLRYARDDREGEENVQIYSESNPAEFRGGALAAGNLGLAEVFLLSGLPNGTLAGAPTGATDANGLLLSELGAPLTSTASTLQFNLGTGALDPATLAQTGNAITRFRGIPTAINFYRPVEETFDAWTWRVNVDWEPNEHSLFYAGVTTGYRAGGFNLVNLSNDPVYDQEEITAYEIGWKDQLFDRSLQINASIYYYDYEDIHTSFDGFSNSLGALVNNVAPVPSAEVFGVEFDVFWLATDRLALGGNFSYTDSQYTAEIEGLVDTIGDGIPDTSQSLVTDRFNANIPTSLFPTLADTQVSIDGNQLLLVPEIKWTVFGIYTLPLGNNGDIEFRTNLSYTDEVFFSVENNPVDKAPEYYRWDARVSWTSRDKNFVVSGFVNNILDEIGVRQISRYEENQNYLRAATPTDPRLFGLEFTYRFGAYNP
ncbi:MAG: TonB-dependent receptor [Pseudomonadota bacterium]